MPGAPLPEPVRVAVRNGGLPVARSAGAVRRPATAVPSSPPGRRPVDAPPSRPTPTASPQVRWRLNPAGPTTQTLTIRRLDDHGRPVDAPVVVTGRLSVARQVAWDPPKCERFRDTRTVQDALEGLIRTREIRCLGGDGQAVREQGEVVQRPVRVVVVDGCGPVAGAAVTARAGNRITGPGRVAEAKEGEPAPATLGPDAQVTVRTGEDGVAAFWWLPFFGNGNWSTLDIGLEGAGDAPIRVVANLDAGGSAGRTAGVHIAEPHLRATGDGSRTTTRSASRTSPRGSGSGSTGPSSRRRSSGSRWCGSFSGCSGRGATRSGSGTRQARSGSTPSRSRPSWRPTATRSVGCPPPRSPSGWRRSSSPSCRTSGGRSSAGSSSTAGRSCPGRIPASTSTATPRRSSTTARAAPCCGCRPTTRSPAASSSSGSGWRAVAERRSAAVPDVVGRTTAAARREIEALGLVVGTSSEPSGERKGRVLRVDPAPGTALLEGDTVSVVVSKGRAG